MNDVQRLLAAGDREAAKARLVELASTTTPDRALLEAIAQKGWDDVLVELVPFVDPETLSKEFLLKLLQQGCVRSAYGIAQRAARAGVKQHKPEMWIIGTLVQCEAPGPQEVEPLIGWSLDDVAALLEAFADHADWFTKGFSTQTVSEVRLILADLYKRKKSALDERLSDLAAQFASQNTAGIAVGVTVAVLLTLFVVVPSFAFAHNAAVPALLFLAAVLLGVWSGKAAGKSMRRRMYERRLKYLRERQARIDGAIG